MTLKNRIERFYDEKPETLDVSDALRNFNELKFFINKGELRAAVPSKESPTGWRAEQWVKKGILLGFRIGELHDYSLDERFRYFDKHTYPLKRFTAESNVRVVPGGTSVRDCTYIAPKTVIMPPSYINAGAYLDEGTMIDSNALIGSCTQIGRRVHIGAGTQIGGVLEPITALPVIIEDDVFIGGLCGIFEGTVLKRRSVLGAGVVLTGSTPVYDLVKNTVYTASGDAPLVIPENAVVVPGSRAVQTPFAQQHRIAISTPVIVKYRDEQTDARLALEAQLR